MQAHSTPDDFGPRAASHCAGHAEVGRAPLADPRLFEALACPSHRSDAIGEVWRLHHVRFGDLRAFPWADGFATTRYVSMYSGDRVDD